MVILYLLLGLGGLLLGAEMAVSGSLALARRWGWPSWVTGVILLALGTSLPELFVSAASAPDHPGLALGNIFGSNAINVGGVLGLMLLLQPTKGIPLRDVRVAAVLALLVGSLLAFAAFAQATIPGWAGPTFLLLYVAILLSSLRSGKAAPFEVAELVAGGSEPHPPQRLFPSAGLTLGGFALLALASTWFLQGALGVAVWLHWDDGFTGYIVAAAGTSAPEFFTSVKAIRKGHAGAVFGNVLGSNAFNLLVVGGVSSLLAAAPINPAMAAPQIWVNLVACLVLLLPFVVHRQGGRRTRTGVASGGILLLAYLVSAWWVGVGQAGMR
jgi:cation:H+ antiporter